MKSEKGELFRSEEFLDLVFKIRRDSTSPTGFSLFREYTSICIRLKRSGLYWK